LKRTTWKKVPIPQAIKATDVKSATQVEHFYPGETAITELLDANSVRVRVRWLCRSLELPRAQKDDAAQPIAYLVAFSDN